MHQERVKLSGKLSITSKNSKLKTSIICNGFGCSKPSTHKITQSIGKFGIIELDLCSVCIKKFGCNSMET